MKNYSKNICIVILLVTIHFMSGCSLIGYGVGAIYDARAPETKQIGPWAAKTVNPDEKVTIHVENDRSISGTFNGIGTGNEMEYRQKYSQFTKQFGDPCNLPVLNDIISINLKSGDVIEGRFQGFDLSIKELDNRDPYRFIFHNTDSYCITLGDNQENKTNKYLLYNIESFSVRDHAESNVHCLYKLSLERELPLVSEISINDSTGIINVDVDDITSLEIKNRCKGKSWGLGIGIAMDVITASVILIARKTQ